ncbi:hypothetical protein QWA68_000626 [Fusarium oxysporum]|nr:hypothetical protein QWA68_000626 [Fusarium oxysporum]
MSYLRGPGHPNESVNYDLAITRLGVLVLKCGDDKKEMNNTVSKRHVTQMDDKRRLRHRACQAYRDLKHDPQHGEIPMAWWDLGKKSSQKPSHKAAQEEDLKLFAFLVLPFIGRESNSFGFRMYGWAEDYKPGGKKALERKYPIMCFDEGKPWSKGMFCLDVK